MDHVNSLLDKATEMCGTKNDSDLARRLGVRHTTVSNWRHGRAKPDVIAAEKLAKMTHGNLAKIVAVIEESRALSAEAKPVWRRIAAAAVIFLAVYTSTLPAIASTAENLTYPGHSRHCALKRLLARILLAVRSRIWGEWHGQAAVC